MLKVIFTQDFEVAELFCGASLGSKTSLFFSKNLFSLGSEPVQDDCQHDFTRMIDWAYGSVPLAELYAAIFREYDNQKSMGSLSRSYTDLWQNIYHGLHACLNKFCWYIITPCRLLLFSAATAI